jgi:hypothetical protein
MTCLDKEFDLVIFKDAIFEVCVRWLFFCAFIWEYLCLVWCWIISHPNKMCIELSSCNVNILASLKSTSFRTLFVGLLIMCSILLYTLIICHGSDLGQSMCHHYLVVYALKEITCTLHCHFSYRNIYTPLALHVWYPGIKLACKLPI